MILGAETTAELELKLKRGQMETLSSPRRDIVRQPNQNGPRQDLRASKRLH
jgi:hypothetical protein